MKDFPLYSPILLTLWLKYLQTRMKASCMYLCQLFFKVPRKTLKLQKKLLPLQIKKYRSKHEKSPLSTLYKVCFSSLSTLGISHGDSELSKLQKNWIFGLKTAVEKSAWIKACILEAKKDGAERWDEVFFPKQGIYTKSADALYLVSL